jgi:glycerol-3-phosphate dehydrogenase
LISVAGTKYTTARAVAERVTDRILSKLGHKAVPCRTATEPLPMSVPTGEARLIHAARNEMAVTLVDALVRRTPLGALGYPGDKAAARAADVVGGELGWNEERKTAELAELRRFYAT